MPLQLIYGESTRMAYIGRLDRMSHIAVTAQKKPPRFSGRLLILWTRTSSLSKFFQT